MWMRSSTPALAVLASLWSLAGADVDPIVIKGSKFFYKTNGTQFYIKGVAYQQNVVQSGGNANAFTDPLADASGCARDLPYLQQLDTNTIRVYAVDPKADHSQCMTMFANAGIYALIDLGSPNTSITSTSPSWTVDLFNRYKSVVDAFAQYNNVLGFFSGNEVVFNYTQADAAAFVKASTRDTKAYIKSKGYRTIGVGYATEDDPTVVNPIAAYLNCGDQSSAIDFFGYNVYSWCGESSFTASHYDTRTEHFSTYSVPVFFSEYGCNLTQPRLFQDTPVIYGPLMDDVWSGALVYEYFNDENNYGLVSLASGSSSVSVMPDFTSLSSQIATVSPTIVTASNYNPTNTAPACSSPVSSFAVAASPLPPTPDQDVCNCMYAGLSCKPVGSVPQSQYGSLFNYVCGPQGGADCSGINANGTTGTYGKFSGCNPVVKLGYVLNQYYTSQGSKAAACSFGGSAVLVSPSATGSCGAVLSSAGASGGSGGSASSSSKGAAAAVHVSPVMGARSGGFTFAALLVPIAFVSGIGMILL